VGLSGDFIVYGIIYMLDKSTFKNS